MQNQKMRKLKKRKVREKGKSENLKIEDMGKPESTPEDMPENALEDAPEDKLEDKPEHKSEHEPEDIRKMIP